MNARRSIADRAGAPLALVDPQESMFDQVLDDPELSEALEKRERARAENATAKARYEERAATVKGKLDALDLGDDTIVRCGRFRIKVTPPGESSHVEYDTVPRRNVTISLLD